MAYIDLYGRNPDTVETAFDYPQPVMPLRMAPRTYLQLPAAANRIFGNPSLRVADGDDVVVALDPSSTYERTMRWKGLGSMSASFARAGSSASSGLNWPGGYSVGASAKGSAGKGKDGIGWGDRHPLQYNFMSNAIELAKEQPWLTATMLGMGTLLILRLSGVIGKAVS